jgi:hypothetical protein
LKEESWNFLKEKFLSSDFPLGYDSISMKRAFVDVQRLIH